MDQPVEGGGGVPFILKILHDLNSQEYHGANFSIPPRLRIGTVLLIL